MFDAHTFVHVLLSPPNSLLHLTRGDLLPYGLDGVLDLRVGDGPAGIVQPLEGREDRGTEQVEIRALRGLDDEPVEMLQNLCLAESRHVARSPVDHQRYWARPKQLGRLVADIFQNGCMNTKSTFPRQKPPSGFFLM